MDAASNEERANSVKRVRFFNLKNLYQTDGELDFNKIAGLAGLGGRLDLSSQPTRGSGVYTSIYCYEKQSSQYV